MTEGHAEMSLDRFKRFGRPICGRYFAEKASLRHLRSLFAGGSGPAEPAHLRSVLLH